MLIENVTASAEQLLGCAELMEPFWGETSPFWAWGWVRFTPQGFWLRRVSPGWLGRGMETSLSLVPEHGVVRKGVIKNLGGVAV